VKPVRSPHPALTEAAIQIVKKMPRWIPAEHEGKKVRCRFNLPFMFRLSYDVEEASAVNDSVYNDAQKLASFPGGQEAFSKWMSENFQYPDSCMKEGIQGKVILQFVVNTDGSIVDVKPVRSPHPALTEAAIQIVKKMPRWIPAEHEGKKVRCRFNLPFMFRLSYDETKNKTEENSEGLRVSRYKLHELPSDILIVMDDKPYEGSPKDLVMEDIESITVLQKSSVLTAQYGARAANGVIQITTKANKKGQVGK
jgi:TonB family protein